MQIKKKEQKWKNVIDRWIDHAFMLWMIELRKNHTLHSN